MANAKLASRKQDIRLDISRTIEFTFQVRACSDAILTLISSQGNKAAEVILGHEGRGRIEFFEESGSPAVEVEFGSGVDLVSCHVYRKFW